MNDITFYFQVHQPYRLRDFRFFDIGRSEDYFDDAENKRILERVAEKCYLPMNALLLRAIREHEGRFRCAFSISGTALDQFEEWSPETLASFQELAATGHVEFLAETSQHSLSALFDETEFRAQVSEHAQRIEELFGAAPTCFRNTELVVDNRIARIAEEMGFVGILGEGADHLLGWRSPLHVYRPERCARMKMFLRAYRLADDIAFRFSNREWQHWPLQVETFSQWLDDACGARDGQSIGLFMDYETFGEHQWADTGIFDFMEELPRAVLASSHMRFRTPSEVFAERDPLGRIDVPDPVSWADAERDLTAWLGNHMQRAANEALWELAPRVRQAAEEGQPELLRKWRRLTTSDHLYYMCTKWFSDGDVHKYFSPYSTPHDAFITFMNVLDDLRRRIVDIPRPAPAPASERETVTPEALDAPADVVACGAGVASGHEPEHGSSPNPGLRAGQRSAQGKVQA